MMDLPSPSIRSLSKRLLALESARQIASGEPGTNTARICETLKVSLIRFAGTDGFSALLRRALVLAQAHEPLLKDIHVKGDGTLEGLAEMAADDPAHGQLAAETITAHLLWLLVTFIGEPLTLTLVQEAWPDAL